MAYTASRKCRVIQTINTSSNMLGKIFINNNVQFRKVKAVFQKDGPDHSWRLCNNAGMILKEGVWYDIGTGDIIQHE